jgi:hypothetical protein
LAWSGQRASKQHFDLFEFDADFFTHLTAQSCLRLFALTEESARDTPTAIRAKNVFEQENPALIVKDDCARGNRETPLAGAHQATAYAARQSPPYCAKKFDEHWTRRISCPTNFSLSLNTTS